MARWVFFFVVLWSVTARADYWEQKRIEISDYVSAYGPSTHVAEIVPDGLRLETTVANGEKIEKVIPGSFRRFFVTRDFVYVVDEAGLLRPISFFVQARKVGTTGPWWNRRDVETYDVWQELSDTAPGTLYARLAVIRKANCEMALSAVRGRRG